MIELPTVVKVFSVLDMNPSSANLYSSRRTPTMHEQPPHMPAPPRPRMHSSGPVGTPPSPLDRHLDERVGAHTTCRFQPLVPQWTTCSHVQWALLPWRNTLVAPLPPDLGGLMRPSDFYEHLPHFSRFLKTRPSQVLHRPRCPPLSVLGRDGQAMNTHLLPHRKRLAMRSWHRYLV